MLDQKHPHTKYVFEAAGLMGGLLKRGQEMTVAPSQVRANLLMECIPILGELRDLNERHFGDSRYIAFTIDDYENAIRTLALLGDKGIVKDCRHEGDKCPYCNAAIMKVNATYRAKGAIGEYIVVCPRCADLYMPAHERLDSIEGFGTIAI